MVAGDNYNKLTGKIQMSTTALQSIPLALLLAAGPAGAVTITEADDYAGVAGFSSTFVGELSLGINTISGSMYGICVDSVWGVDCNGGAPEYGDTQDSFAFEVPAGMRLVSIVASASDVFAPDGYYAIVSLDDGYGYYVNQFPPVLGTTGNLLTQTYGPGVYGASFNGATANVPGSYSTLWTLTVEVSSVPVPTAAWLFGSGLLGLIGMARKSVR